MKLPKRALTNIDIEKYAKKLKLPNFRGVFMRNRLPTKINKIEMGVINLDDADGGGTHWVAYKKYGDDVIYFDSFGNLKPPMEVVKYFKSVKNIKIRYNYDVYQTYNAVNCGHLCLEFLYE